MAGSVQDFKNRGNDFFKRGDYRQAIENYSQAIQRQPDDEKLYSNRAAAYSATGQHELALRDAEKVITLKRDWVKGHFRAGVALLKLGRYDEAVAALTRALELTDKGDDPELQERLNEARACLKADYAKKTEASVRDPAEAKRIGNARFKESDYTTAAKWYTHAIELAQAAPGSVPPEELAVFYTNRAACHAQTHQWKQVIADCDDAVNLDPRNSKAILRRAIAYESLEKWAKAAEDYRKVISLEPGASNASAGLQRCTKYAQ